MNKGDNCGDVCDLMDLWTALCIYGLTRGKRKGLSIE